MAFDTYMIVLTVRKTADHAMGMRRLSQKSISELLLRDGRSLSLNDINCADVLIFSSTFRFTLLCVRLLYIIMYCNDASDSAPSAAFVLAGVQAGMVVVSSLLSSSVHSSDITGHVGLLHQPRSKSLQDVGIGS